MKRLIAKNIRLSSEDNKIVGLKLKFVSMYTLNRMGAKTEEMEKS
jgi:hypothetical protein